MSDDSRSDDPRFQSAIVAIDEANRQDPRKESVEGIEQPRELLFAQRVYEWVEKLVDRPSEALLLAARGHTIRRWMIPRDTYPKTTLGYHEWRSALADFHADETAKILADCGYTDDFLGKVRAFITRSNWPADPEAQALEDADCLVFLQTKLAGYIDEWGEGKTVRILRSTIKKMTPAARAIAMELDLDPSARDLVQRAAS